MVMLFLHYLVCIGSFFALIANEDALFSSPVPGTPNVRKIYGSSNLFNLKKDFRPEPSPTPHVSNEGYLFNSPVPPLPWQTVLRNQWNIYNTEAQAHPFLCLTGAATGTAGGYGIVQLSNYAFNKGQNALEKALKVGDNSSNSFSSKAFSFLSRNFNRPFVQGTIKTTSIGKKCLLGLSVVVHRETIKEKLMNHFPKFFSFFR